MECKGVNTQVTIADIFDSLVVIVYVIVIVISLCNAMRKDDKSYPILHILLHGGMVEASFKYQLDELGGRKVDFKRFLNQTLRLSVLAQTFPPITDQLQTM